MDPGLLTVLGVAAVGVVLATLFLLSRRKLAEEMGKQPLYEERCSASWRFAHGVVVAGANIPIARISFYDDFFVVALVRVTMVRYSEIQSADFRNGWLSNSITIQLAKGRRLVLHPRNLERVRSLVERTASK